MEGNEGYEAQPGAGDPVPPATFNEGAQDQPSGDATAAPAEEPAAPAEEPAAPAEEPAAPAEPAGDGGDVNVNTEGGDATVEAPAGDGGEASPAEPAGE